MHSDGSKFPSHKCYSVQFCTVHYFVLWLLCILSKIFYNSPIHLIPFRLVLKLQAHPFPYYFLGVNDNDWLHNTGIAIIVTFQVLYSWFERVAKFLLETGFGKVAMFVRNAACGMCSSGTVLLHWKVLLFLFFVINSEGVHYQLERMTAFHWHDESPWFKIRQERWQDF